MLFVISRREQNVHLVY